MRDDLRFEVTTEGNRRCDLCGAACEAKWLQLFAGISERTSVCRDCVEDIHSLAELAKRAN
jgi:hypothetical protein